MQLALFRLPYHSIHVMRYGEAGVMSPVHFFTSIARMQDHSLKAMKADSKKTRPEIAYISLCYWNGKKVLGIDVIMPDDKRI